MNDLEQRLRSELSNEVDRLGTQVPENAPARVRRRIRRRQTAAVASLAVTAMAVAAVAFVAADTLGESPPVRPAQSPETAPSQVSPSHPPPPDDRIVVATGSYQGKEWEYSVYPDGEDWCDWVEYNHAGGGGCGPAGARQGRWSIGWSSGGDDDPALVNGWVPDAATRVIVELDSGETIEASIYTPPADRGVPHRVFMAWIEKREFEGQVKALDQGDHALVHQRIKSHEPVHPPFPPKNQQVIKTGTSFGLDWELFVHEDNEMWCSGVDLGFEGAGSSCSHRVDSFEVSGDMPASEERNFLWGVLNENVARIVYELDDGRAFEAEISETPAPVPWRVFLISFSGGNMYEGPDQVSGFVVGLDEAGNEVHRIAWPPDFGG